MLDDLTISRRNLLATSLAGTLSTSLSAQSRQPERLFKLVTRELRTYKIADRGRFGTESWVATLLAQTEQPIGLSPTAMKVSLMRGPEVVRTSQYGPNGFSGIAFETQAPRVLPDGREPTTPFYWPFALRLRASEPVALGIDSMRIEVTAAVKGGRSATSGLTIPVESYVQKTKLRFPFEGKGIVLQGGAMNGGHANRSGLFAIDSFYLDDAWSIIASGEGKLNTDYPGFGRPLLAPADGIVVRARSDRPDQPIGDVSDPKFYVPEFPKGGDPGNFLVIDHGDQEFSMMAHFQAGSMAVRAGDRVRTGQKLGLLGHSGDTTAPHLHYQLQGGPDWQFADGLPFRFSNVEDFPLDRGTYFEAKF